MEYFSFIIFKMLFFIFWPLPEKLLDCPKKIILHDSGGGCSPPAHTPVVICCRASTVFVNSQSPVDLTDPAYITMLGR